ncbi:MAG: hypothetical protein JWM53_195, partial [bacterium]|nr:hypothetical protein [bacterium]
VRRNVDILVMIDNSPGTSPKIAELRNRFPALLQRLGDFAANGQPASYHIGVVDSDLGAGPFTLNQGQCHPDGDGGLLRVGPGPGASGPAVCAGLTLGNGERFIDYDSGSGATNIGGFNVADAFSCISQVGTAGCGFEAPLEAVYRVLTTPSVNPGFLRDDSLIAVLWMTDEDDCSAPPDSQLFDPSPAAVGTWGVMHSFRCTQWGVTCGGKPLGGDALAPTSDCAPAVGGPLFDVSRYTQLLSPGGLRARADDLVLASIVAPPAPVGVQITMPCADQTNTASCPILEHSCIATTNTAFFADPAVRIGAVTTAVPGAIVGSVCDVDYSPTITAFGDAIGARLTAGCLPGALGDVASPSCTVTIDGSTTPRCDGSGAMPCWEVVADTRCAARTAPSGDRQQLRLAVDGASASAVISSRCSVYEPAP